MNMADMHGRTEKEWLHADRNKLIAENARLRAALEEIRDKTPANKHEVWPHHHWYLHRASTALEGGE